MPRLASVPYQQMMKELYNNKEIMCLKLSLNHMPGVKGNK